MVSSDGAVEGGRAGQDRATRHPRQAWGDRRAARRGTRPTPRRSQCGDRHTGRFLVVLSLSLAILGLGTSARRSHGQQLPDVWRHLEVGPHGSSLVVSHAWDDARVLRSAGTARDERDRRTRPMRVYMWFPISKRLQDATLTLRECAWIAATDQRGQPLEIAEKARHEGALQQRLGPRADAAALDTPTRTIYQSLPEAGQFPAVLLALDSATTSPLEHLWLCEYLSSRGYYVLSAPQRERRRAMAAAPDADDGGANGWSVVDLYDQVRDLEWLYAYARDQRYVDQDRVAVIGYGTGALAALSFQMRTPDVHAVVTIEAVGSPPLHDASLLPLLRRDPLFDLRHASAPILSMGPVRDDGGAEHRTDGLDAFVFAPQIRLDCPEVPVPAVTGTTWDAMRAGDSATAAYAAACAVIEGFFGAALGSGDGPADLSDWTNLNPTLPAGCRLTYIGASEVRPEAESPEVPGSPDASTSP